jgi:hypothetical protein
MRLFRFGTAHRKNCSKSWGRKSGATCRRTCRFWRMLAEIRRRGTGRLRFLIKASMVVLDLEASVPRSRGINKGPNNPRVPRPDQTRLPSPCAASGDRTPSRFRDQGFDGGSWPGGPQLSDAARISLRTNAQTESPNAEPQTDRER